ncbi:hypothetical protein EZS27_032915, partial [termite gut metagenome]
REEKPIEGKKKYRKKNPNAARLCADDVMARDKLKRYQDSYAQRMQAYGLQRGIEGSEAKHINTQQYYRELYVKNENLKGEIEDLQEQKEATQEKVRSIYEMKDEARDKFLAMDEYAKQKNKELATIEAKLQQAKKDYEPYRAQEELNLIHELFPMMKEQLRVANLCQKIGFTIETVRQLLKGITLSIASGKLYSFEYKQYFEVKEAIVKIDHEPNNPNKLRLTINGTNIIDWFKLKYKEVRQRMGFNTCYNPPKNKRVKL